jgi:hypothetical protein
MAVTSANPGITLGRAGALMGPEPGFLFLVLFDLHFPSVNDRLETHYCGVK